MGKPATQTRAQTVVFRDPVSEWSSSANATEDSTRHSTMQADDSLAQFFARPIQIASYVWTPANVTPLTATLNPWSAFFTNPRVANRISNYHLITARLRVKVLINGNSFYYGRLMMDYVPFPSFDTAWDSSLTNLGNAVGASQRQHIYIDPTTSVAGEFELPFIWPGDNAALVNADLAVMGSLYIRELIALKHANAAITPVEITVMAWAEDVHLAIPTTINTYGLTAQADEYTMGPLSTSASAVASMARRLSSIPIIGPYAKATDMVSSAIGSAARLFGFSRPVQLTESAPMRPQYFGPISNTDMADPVSKLTVDSKQELSIDPRIFGADLGDELTISGIASRESYVGQFAWAVNRVPDALLWNARVNPRLLIQAANVYYMPACAFALGPFSWWRGCVRYRFQVVASGFHKGRLKIMWDPSYIAGPETNVAFTRIVDISTERDFTIDVPWGQSTAYRNVAAHSTGSSFQSTTAYTSAGVSSNGVLGIYVLNTLVSPNSVANNDISILVSICMEDVEVAVPNDVSTAQLTTVYNYTPQSQEDEVDAEGAPVTEHADEEMLQCHPAPDRALVYFGERIQSFRQLLRRYAHHSSYLCGTATAATTGDVIWNLVLPDFPQYRGYAPGAMHVTSTAGKYNYCNSTLLSYLTPAFLGVRGSMRSKYKVRTPGVNEVLSLTASRTTLYGYANQTVPVTFAGQSKFAALVETNYPSLFQGAAITAPEKQPVLEVEFPYYKNSRFDLARCVTGEPSANSPLGAGNTHHMLQATLTGTSTKAIDRFVSVGEDFQLFYFMGAPPMRGLGTPAAG